MGWQKPPFLRRGESGRLCDGLARLAQRVGALRAREADRAELERVFAERNRLAKEMARMVEPIVQIPHLYQGSTLVAAGSDL